MRRIEGRHPSNSNVNTITLEREGLVISGSYRRVLVLLQTNNSA